MDDFSHLFSPFQLGGVPLRNRVAMLPMTTGFCERDQTVGGRLVDFYAARAVGGAGLLIAPFAPLRTGSPVDAGLYDDRFVGPARCLTDAVHQAGAKLSAQLITTYYLVLDGPAGRGVPEVVGPSAVPNALLRVTPRELTVDEIASIVAEYGTAAGRAKAARFDMIEIMAGGGYLLNRFLSPLTNKREDAYGGSSANRLRLLVEIVENVRGAVGDDLPVMVRLNLDEQMKGGYTASDALDMARELVRRGVGGFTSYTGWHESPVPTVQASVPKAAFAHLAAALRQATGVPVVAANRISDPVTAEAILAAGHADLVGLGRPLLADPEWPEKAQSGRAEEIVPCIACSTCLAAMLTTYKEWGRPASTCCAVNPLLGSPDDSGRSQQARVSPPRPKKVLVIGGGPAGLEAARAAAMRGHQVTVYEKAERPGGRLLVAALPPHKHEVAALADVLAVRAARAGVRVRLGCFADRSTVEAEQPDVLVVAAGAAPHLPQILGVESSQVVLAEDVLTGSRGVRGEVVIIGGGMVGCETAEYLAARRGEHDGDPGGGAGPGGGPEGAIVDATGGVASISGVTIVEMLDRIAADVPVTTRPFLLARLRRYGIRMLTGTRAAEICPPGVRVEGVGGSRTLAADCVVIATGYRPDEMNGAFLGIVPATYAIGDGAGGRTIKEAMEQGSSVGRSI